MGTNNSNFRVEGASITFSPGQPRQKKSRIYVNINEGEGVNAGPEKQASLLAALTAFLVAQTGQSVRFSSKAGCSCGCSPGFIIEGKPFVRGRRAQDAHMDLYVSDTEEGLPEAAQKMWV
jgi:hypothetical protein